MEGNVGVLLFKFERLQLLWTNNSNYKLIKILFQHTVLLLMVGICSH